MFKESLLKKKKKTKTDPEACSKGTQLVTLF